MLTPTELPEIEQTLGERSLHPAPPPSLESVVPLELDQA